MYKRNYGEVENKLSLGLGNCWGNLGKKRIRKIEKNRKETLKKRLNLTSNEKTSYKEK